MFAQFGPDKRPFDTSVLSALRLGGMEGWRVECFKAWWVECFKAWWLGVLSALRLGGLGCWRVCVLAMSCILLLIN